MLSTTINITWRTIMGALFVGAAVAISSLTIVRAEHVTPDKKKTVFDCSSRTACLTGDSSAGNTLGIHAVGPGTALQGETSTTKSGSGVAGISIASSGNGHGVYGKSSNGNGVYGTSSTASGVYGTTRAYATVSSPVAGVYGTSSAPHGANGVYGYGAGYGDIGVTGEAGYGGIALDAQADNSYGDIFFEAVPLARTDRQIPPCLRDECAPHSKP